MDERASGEAYALLGRARTRLCALPLGHVVETMRPLPTTPLAGAPAFVAGLSVIRGQPVPVVDVGALLGSPEPPAATRFVIVRAGDRRVALALEAVLGVRVLPDGKEPLPPLLQEAGAEAVSAVATLDRELLVVLRAGRLVPDALWASLPAGGPR